MDAKNYVHLTDRQYDVIVNDSIHPRDFAENASLYGKEYFEASRARLNPGGLMVSWLPTYHMSERGFDSILGTSIQQRLGRRGNDLVNLLATAAAALLAQGA